MENLSLLAPAWYLLLCFLMAIGLSGLLYYRSKDLPLQSNLQKWALWILRTLVIFLLTALLLSPFLKITNTQLEKPTIVIGQDESLSTKTGFSEATWEQYQNEINALISELSQDYEVKTLSFGEKVSEEFDFTASHQVTNISQFLEYVADQYNDQNLGAVIMASDGIYNEGKNPIYNQNQLNAPVYSIALGDTLQKKDAKIQRVFHNELAYLGDRFKIQVDVSSFNCKGQNAQLAVYHIEGKNRKKLDSQSIVYQEDDYFNTREFILEANQTGVQRYRLALSPVSGEETADNNYRDIYIDVLDARQKVLFYAASPHPDLSAIKQSLEANKNYEVEITYYGKLTQNLKEYDLVVFHQLPAQGKPIQNVFPVLNEANIGRLFILGSLTDVRLFNTSQDLIKIDSRINNTNEVQAKINPSFGLFTLSDELKNNINNFPPLISPFGNYEANPGVRRLFDQSIGKVETTFPLWAFKEEGDVKSAVISGEGIWKWRLYDYLSFHNHDISNELLNKTIQYVALKEDKRKFRVFSNAKLYRENEEILLDGELYNDSYELINNPDAFLSIFNEEGQEYTFTFDKTSDHYILNAGLFPEGNYTYRGRTIYNNETLTHTGKFSVQPIQLESYNTTANHGLLRVLSQPRGGELVLPQNISSLATKIRDRNDVQSIAYSQTMTRPFLNIKWFFFVLFILLGAEWFLRRYFGGY